MYFIISNASLLFCDLFLTAEVTQDQGAPVFCNMTLGTFDILPGF
jgi:hypothetical protein